MLFPFGERDNGHCHSGALGVGSSSLSEFRDKRHLARNPWVCDCNLRGLGEYLQLKPSIETSNAKCEAPPRMQRKRLAGLLPEELVCRGAEEVESHWASECLSESPCPKGCSCDGTKVDCGGRTFTDIPPDIPRYVTHLYSFLNLMFLLKWVLQNGSKLSPCRSSCGCLPSSFQRDDKSRPLEQPLLDRAFIIVSGKTNPAAPVLPGLSSPAFDGARSTPSLYPSFILLSLFALQNGFVTVEEQRPTPTSRNACFLFLHPPCPLSLLLEQLHERAHDRWFVSKVRSRTRGKNPSGIPVLIFSVLSRTSLRPAEGNVAQSGRVQGRSRDPEHTKALSAHGSSGLRRRLIRLAEVSRIANSRGRKRSLAQKEEVGAWPHCAPSIVVSSESVGHKKCGILSDNKITTIKADGVLSLLPNLQHLDLQSNDISRIEDGAFKSLSKLTHLNLLENPLSCNCHMAWLSSWYRKQGAAWLKSAPVCFAPFHLNGKSIALLDEQNFKCTGSDVGCVGDGHCPEGCRCESSIVRCSKAKLKEIPRDIPPHATELYLDVNDIKEIPADRINHLKDLTRLDLSNNQIGILSDGMFSNLTSLDTLLISYNKLQCITRDAFRGLSSLRILSLQGNDISQIPEGTFEGLDALSHLALGSNPLYCDCSLRWLSIWVKQDYIEPGIARCHEPLHMRNKLVLTSPSDSFKCSGQQVPADILSKCDSCYSFPCDNGGTCLSLPLRKYKCNCAPGYYGDKCQHVIDACYGSPCENGGTCKVKEHGRFTCHCALGFEGDYCEKNTDDCVYNKCQNNATCVDLVGKYRCECPAGFSGPFCESKISFCSKEFNPCQNGADCRDHTSFYTCECLAGFSGQNCSQNNDDCENHLCMNGATCVDEVNSYSCKCPEGFWGKYCELTPIVEMMYPQTSPCQQHDCKNGICFQPNSDSSDYICKCSPGYSGKRCDFLTAVSLVHNASFVELETLRTKPFANITMVFKTKEEQGILIYFGQSQHIAVELFRGRIRISYDVGNYPVSTMFSYEKVSDGEAHKVELLAVQRNFTLRVDGGVPRTIINDGEREYLDIMTPLYVGGVPVEIGARAKGQWHLRNITSLSGCIQALHLNQKLVNFEDAWKRHKVVAGCGQEEPDVFAVDQPPRPRLGALRSLEEVPRVVEAVPVFPLHHQSEPDEDLNSLRYDVDEEDDNDIEDILTHAEDVCKGHKCNNGKCVPKATGLEYTCKCKGGWGGKYCDKEPTCAKEKYRDYFRENNCRSRKPVTNARCIGKCGSRCCTAKRTKKRRVRLICNDGTRYIKEIDIVRRCGCAKQCA
ncbi:unnamed protein product [Cyprideis torosa]|uniref:Uncharacterized protein n=1 Tax=Cyprideis torosa TaxID=163714 RepID=A0A7R8W8N0_9CRUS|nr:unnamed protein product [Cyprideis torosa]CAG0888765.1 unnamed protein product [Cyprideis torosa]